MPISDDELDAMESRVAAASKGPWQAFVEGRDHDSGDDFIRTGGLDDGAPDMYVSQYVGATSIKVPAADLDLIASARQDIPRLIAEVRRLRDQPAT